MKKLLLMCCLIAGITTLSKAQGQQRRTPEEQAKQLQTQLKLTDDQTAKITSIYQMQSTKLDSVRTAANGDRDAMRSGMMSIRQASAPKIKAILTPEQGVAYDKVQADMRARQQNGGGGAPPSPQK